MKLKIAELRSVLRSSLTLLNKEGTEQKAEVPLTALSNFMKYT